MAKTLDLSGNVSTPTLHVHQPTGSAIQLSWTGAPVGDFVVEESVDPDTLGWVENTDISAVAAGGSSGSAIWELDLKAPYYRITFKRTSGSGTATYRTWGKQYDR